MARRHLPLARRHLPRLLPLLVGLLPAAGAVALAADAPTGPTVVVEAVGDPDVRASIEFPAGWRLEASEDPARRQINALRIDQRCELSTRRSELPDLTTDVDDFVVGLAPGSGFIFIDRQSLELPAGPAERVDFAADEGGRWSVYILADEAFRHELWCRGDELPNDRWLPVAETFDLDPAPELASSPFDGTVQRPDAGLAMTFPESWHVRGSSTNLGLLYATSGSAVCAVSDYSSLAAENGWASVDDMHDEYVGVARARDNLSVAESSYLDLPAGRTGFADISFDDGTRAIRYSFADPGSGTLLALFCVGDPTPADRYRSLAGSVTWLATDRPE